MNKINIAMATDKNYIIPTKVAMSSILDAAGKDSFYEFHILCSSELDSKSREKLSALERNYVYLNVSFHEIAGEELNNATTTAHIPVASYYRLYMSREIEADRCLFIDGDMIIREDLQPVYNMDLEGCYIAGVRDMGVRFHAEEFSGYADYLGIASMDEYVNAGFTLFDLKKIREDGLDQVFISAIRHGYKYMDQDIINKYCYGRIKHLPLRYDYFTEYDGDSLREYDKYYSKQELADFDHKCVLHYTGGFKPWICRRLKINQYWWDQAEKILSEEEYHTVLNQAREFEEKSDWTYILEKVDGEKEVVIFGFSEIGRTVAEQLQNTGHDGIAAYADNDSSKYGMQHRGIVVMSVEDICLKFEHPLWIISSQNGFAAIGRQLQKLGIEADRMIRYIWKDRTYYNRLDDKYRDYELQILGG